MECPLCAETMILETREVISRVPGTSRDPDRHREWVCRECDYFEETEETGSRRMERRRKASTRADGEQDFVAQRVLDLLEIQRRLALVAQHFENGRAALFCDFDAAIVELHDVHLQRLHLKIPRVPAIRARQCHSSSSSPCGPA